MKKINFMKRILIVIYDGLLLVAVLFFTLALVMGLFLLVAPDSFTVNPNLLENPKLIQFTDFGRLVGSIVFSVHCLIVSFFFYGLNLTANLSIGK